MSTYLLVPGMWIGAWAWQPVTARLRAAGHDVYPLTLTGVADRSHLLGPGVDLDTHIADIVRLAEVADLREIVLVGHSYGGLPVSAAALRLGDRIRSVVYVDSGPLPEGMSQLDFAGGPPDPAPEAPAAGAGTTEPGGAAAGDGTAGTGGDAVAPRSWDPEADPGLLAGLDEAALELLRTRSTAHPLASVRQPLGARATSADFPTVLIACTFPLDRIGDMMAAGHPFFAGLSEAEVVSLPTGHWPMLSEPAELARRLDRIGAA